MCGCVQVMEEKQKRSISTLYFIVLCVTVAAAIPVVVYHIVTHEKSASPELPSRPGPSGPVEDLERLADRKDLFREHIRVRVEGQEFINVTGISKVAGEREARARAATVWLPSLFYGQRALLDDGIAQLFLGLPTGTSQVATEHLELLLSREEDAEGAGLRIEGTGVLSLDESGMKISVRWKGAGSEECLAELIRTSRSGLLFVKYSCPSGVAMRAPFLESGYSLSLDSLTVTSNSYVELSGITIADAQNRPVLKVGKFSLVTKAEFPPDMLAGGVAYDELLRLEGWEASLERVEGQLSALTRLPLFRPLGTLPASELTADRVEIGANGTLRFLNFDLKKKGSWRLQSILAAFSLTDQGRLFSLDEPTFTEREYGVEVTTPAGAVVLDRYNTYHVRLDGYKVRVAPGPLAAANLLKTGAEVRAQLMRLKEGNIENPALILPEGFPDMRLEAVNGDFSFPMFLDVPVTGLTVRATVTGRQLEEGLIRLCLGKRACTDLEASLSVRTDAVGRISKVGCEVSGGVLAGQIVKKGGALVKGLDRSRLECTADLVGGQTRVKAVCQASLHGLSLEHRKIALVPIHFPLIRVEAEVTADLKERKLEISLPKLQMGEVYARAALDITDFLSVPAFRLTVDFPEQNCAALLRSTPAGFTPHLSDVRVEGAIWFSLNFEVDLRDVRRSIRLSIDGSLDKCRALSQGPDINVDELNHPDYVHRVVVAGEDLGIDVGPGTDHYVPLDQIPLAVQAAAYGTEDLAFFKHKGFRTGLIRRALILLFERGYFAYGGSTISQQLVKNLFLNRKKTLSRKFEEAVIVWQMENVVPKERIFELYLNCIEYGPKIWGIARAARTYFGKHPTQLTALEGAFLMGLKPDPAYGYLQYRRGGLNKHWRKNLDRVLKRLLDMGAISREYFDLAMRSRLRFRSAADKVKGPQAEEDRPVREGQEEL